MSELLKRIDNEILIAKLLESENPNNSAYSSLITKRQECRINLQLNQEQIRLGVDKSNETK